MERRGRPAHTEAVPLMVYTQEFDEYVDGKPVKTTWKFDKNKYPRGPYEVTIDYPEGYESESEKLNERQQHLPLTKRQYYHPVTGDLVGYTTYMKCYKEGLTNEHPNEIVW